MAIRIEQYVPQTKNHYLSEAKTFLNWLILQSRIAVNPLASVSKVDQTIKTRVRRALTDEELIRLLESSPQYRGVPYFMSARTGLRYGGAFQPVWKDITFDEKFPCFGSGKHF